MQAGEPRYGSEFRESRPLIIAAERPFGKEIDGDEHAEQQRQKCESEFCEKITPHEFRTSSPRREQSSDGWGFPDRFRFFRAGA